MDIPTGFLNGHRGQPSLIPDPERAPFITQLFDLLASGEWTKADALKRVTTLGLRSRKGVPLTQETLRKVLMNRTYAGEIQIKGWGAPVRGDFVPLVTEETFDRVQAILEGRAPAHVAHVKESDKFPLRGLLLCSDCGKPLSASTSMGKLGYRYSYYHCFRAAGHIRVRADVVEAQFIALLERLVPKPERMRMIERIFRDEWDALVECSAFESLGLRQQLGKLEARKQRVLMQMADGAIGEQDFAQLRAKTASKMVDIRDLLAICCTKARDSCRFSTRLSA